MTTIKKNSFSNVNENKTQTKLLRFDNNVNNASKILKHNLTFLKK